MVSVIDEETLKKVNLMKLILHKTQADVLKLCIDFTWNNHVELAEVRQIHALLKK